MMESLFSDSPEYIQRLQTPFKPTSVTLAEIHAAVPKHLHEKSTVKGLAYVVRDIGFAVATYKLGSAIDPWVSSLTHANGWSPWAPTVIRWSLWVVYWLWQGIIFAGWWCLAHEAGHGSLSAHSWINHLVGYSLHTFLLVPYYSWRSTHHAHHKATKSVEREENFCARTRSELNLPPVSKSRLADYHEIFEETPIYTLGRMLLMQGLGFQWYLCTNIMGNISHPPGTNHFSPWSSLFKPHERNGVIASDIGLATMGTFLWVWARHAGLSSFIKLYFIPYILAHHWIVMLTYLHHSDPSLPHFRGKQWSFLRGALSTVDRPLLGWIGRFFLHNVSHDHIAHHLFSSIPFYNQPKVTEAIKGVLKEDYNYDSTNSFRALYRSFTQCSFIEDEGDIVFYKNRQGKAPRTLAVDALDNPTRRDF